MNSGFMVSLQSFAGCTDSFVYKGCVVDSLSFFGSYASNFEMTIRTTCFMTFHESLNSLVMYHVFCKLHM